MNHSKINTNIAKNINQGDEMQPCLPVDDTKAYKSTTLTLNGEHTNENPQPKSLLEKIKNEIKTNLLLVLTISGIFLGVALGFIGRTYNFSSTTLQLVIFPGELLLRLLKMLILPLIISSLITGLAQLDPKSSGKMGSRAIIFYISTTLIATITGIICALIIRPGSNHQHKSVKNVQDRVPISTLDALLDITRNMFPENIIQAATQSIGTSYRRVSKQVTVVNSTTGANTTETVIELIREIKYADGTNVMGLVVFCIIFGIFISQAKKEAQILLDFFYSLNELIMKIVAVIMWYSPVGILFLVAGNIIKIDNMAETAKRLSVYMITVIIGLIIHCLFTVQMIYFVTTRKNPFKYLRGMLQAWLTAIGTSSSTATLPVTFRCLEEINKVDKRVTRFMLPLGATINMDGTALYQCVATIFIAQLNNISLTAGNIVAISLASTATSIGVAALPSAALVTMLIVLSTVGLPTEDISYIVTVDWFLDRLRTSINVLGDAYGCGIVEHLSRLELKKLDEDAELEIAKSHHAPNNPIENFPNQNPYISVWNEADQQLEQYSDRRTSTKSINSNTGGNTSHPHQEVVQEPSVEPQKQHTNDSEQIPIVVIDSAKRNARQLLFNNPKLPTSVNSMPHISQYSSNISSSKNNNGVNQDSNV